MRHVCICHNQVFGKQTGTLSISLSVLAVELLQAATTSGHSAYAREERSLAGHVHMRLLDLVRGPASCVRKAQETSCGVRGRMPSCASMLNFWYQHFWRSRSEARNCHFGHPDREQWRVMLRVAATSLALFRLERI